MKNTVIKKLLYAVIAIILFLILSYGYVPQVLSGKVVDQGDIRGFRGMSREADLWNATHSDEPATWTNSMFGGMPTIMITGNHKGDYTLPLFRALQWGARPASYLFISLLGAFLLCLAFGLDFLVAIIGAIAITFCSYNMQIIQVGHNTKMLAIAFAPWVLAACTYAYRQIIRESIGQTIANDIKAILPKVLFASVLFAFASSFELKANHIQISYYLAIIMFVYVASMFIWILFQKNKKQLLIRFSLVSSLLFIMGLLAIATNANNMLPTYEYSHQTMRGGSELASEDGKKKDGLDINYATAWSYSWEEIPNLFIANYNGGASASELSMDSNTVQAYIREGGDRRSAAQLAKSLPLYWGPQPFTAGPMYIGAISLFLFILAWGLYKGFEKYYLLIASILAILLALGSHFMIFTELVFKYLPLYNKFRTVSMSLTILQITVPLMGLIGLNSILKEKYEDNFFKKKLFKSLAISISLIALAYLSMIFFASFSSHSDASIPDFFRAALIQDRKDLLFKDSLISVILILLSAFLVFILHKAVIKEDSIKRKYIILSALALLIFANLALVGKRYLNSDHFIAERSFNKITPLREVDKSILEDKSLDYRVLDLTRDVFNDSQTSFYHKSIGGYSPVKMQRYQDLIEYYISDEISKLISDIKAKKALDMSSYQILNMLNTKYIILGDSYAMTNAKAFGNAWFVEDYLVANNPREEIALLSGADLSTQAVVAKDFSQYCLKDVKSSAQDSIVLDSYTPNRLEYHFNLESDRTAVFSEIYYPNAWKVYLDGDKELDLFRLNWILRGVNLPKGEHSLSFVFKSHSYDLGIGLSRCASILMYVLLLFAIVIFLKKESKS